jgi:hypothetical protein
MKVEEFVDAKVRRGPESWAYIYMTLGFTLAIEGTIIQMITPLIFPWNIIAYVALGVVTFLLFISNGPFQNKLIGIKSRYEAKAR